MFGDTLNDMNDACLCNVQLLLYDLQIKQTVELKLRAQNEVMGEFLHSFSGIAIKMSQHYNQLRVFF